MDTSRQKIAARLESVRTDPEVGFPTVKAFWRELYPAEPAERSYEQVRRYHGGESKVPVDYLARVTERFSIRWRWLVEGKGSMKRKPWDTRSIRNPLWVELRDRDFFASFGLHALSDQLAFLGLHRFHQMPGSRARPVREGFPPDGRSELDHAEDLRFLLRLPLIAWGYENAQDVPVEYWRGVMNGLDSAIRHFLELQPRAREDAVRKPRAKRNSPNVLAFRQFWEKGKRQNGE